jgi:hypothetical protein
VAASPPFRVSVTRAGGLVLGNGMIGQGEGFTATRTANGTYTVSFPPGTWDGTTFPVVTVTPYNAHRLATVQITLLHRNGSARFEIRVSDPASGSLVDTGFVFVAVQT